MNSIKGITVTKLSYIFNWFGSTTANKLEGTNWTDNTILNIFTAVPSMDPPYYNLITKVRKNGKEGEDYIIGGIVSYDNGNPVHMVIAKA